MSTKLGLFCIALGAVSIPVYVLDAKVNGRWDSDGVFLAGGLILLAVLEPPLALMIRGYFTRKKIREEREERERAEAAMKAAKAEKLTKQRERDAAVQRAADEAERQEARRKANEAWARKQGQS